MTPDNSATRERKTSPPMLGGATRARLGWIWILIYLLVGITPLLVARTADAPPGREFWLEFSVGLGFVGLALLGLQFATVSRFQVVDATYGVDVLLRFHRWIAIVAFAFVLAHPAIIVIRDPSMLGILNPVTADWQARFGQLSIIALAALIATSIWRSRLRLRYEVWRVIHGVLAVTVIVAALAHIFMVGHYIDGPVKRTLWIAMSVVLIALMVNVYIVQPLRLRERPWEVVEVRPERGSAWTLEIRPRGHAGVEFSPGQFAWIRVRRSPFAVREHPFSFASSAEHDGSLSFGIKEAGDFTSTIGSLHPGERVYLDGPYGAFTYERDEGSRLVFLVGGIGITPVLSMLRTLADRGDTRPCLLLYGSESWDEITYREELTDLEQRMNLTVVHVLEDPAEDWHGESGFIDEDLLTRHLGERPPPAQYLLCGPPPMIEQVEGLIVAHGVPPDSIDHEFFDLV